jgi:transposase
MKQNQSTVIDGRTGHWPQNQDKAHEAVCTIKVGLDVHQASVVVVAQWDNSTPKPPQRFGERRVVEWIAKLKAKGHRIITVYEASGFGFTLHRQLKELGVESYVTTTQILDTRLTGVKTDGRDAHELCLRLDRYVQGNRQSLTMVHVPTPDQEQQRSLSRQRQQLLRQRVALEITGRSLLATQGLFESGTWWRPLRWENLRLQLPDWLKIRLETLRPMLRLLQHQIDKLGLELEASVDRSALPKAVGELSAAIVNREVCDWNRFHNRREISSYTGLCPREFSSGNQRRQGSITKHGNPRLRQALIEMAWRMFRFQPNYHAVKKWKDKMIEAALTNRSRRKKMIVAIARQLAVDLWRINTGQTTPEKLGMTLATI